MLAPMTTPDGPKETGVPDIVTAGPPGMIDVPAMLKPFALAVPTWPPTVRTSEVGNEAISTVLDPTTRAPDGPSDILFPAMVTGSPPGFNELPAIAKPVGLAIKG